MALAEQGHPELPNNQLTLEVLRADINHYRKLEYTGYVVGIALLGVSMINLRNQMPQDEVLSLAAISFFTGNLLHEKVKQIDYLKKQYEFNEKKMPSINNTIQKLQALECPEYRTIAHQLNSVLTNQNRLFSLAYETAILRPNERRKNWEKLYPLVERVRNLTTTVDHSEHIAAHVFGGMEDPSERTERLQRWAGRAIDYINERQTTNETEYDPNYKVLTNISEGKTNFYNVTLFKLCDAAKTFGYTIPELHN